MSGTGPLTVGTGDAAVRTGLPHSRVVASSLGVVVLPL